MPVLLRKIIDFFRSVYTKSRMFVRGLTRDQRQSNFTSLTNQSLHKKQPYIIMSLVSIAPVGYDRIESIVKLIYAQINNIRELIDTNRTYRTSWDHNLATEMVNYSNMYSSLVSTIFELEHSGHVTEVHTQMLTKLTHVVREVITVYNHPERSVYTYERELNNTETVLCEVLFGWYLKSLRVVGV
jgi:hypothetical protein